jgi:hypothetical protein
VLVAATAPSEQLRLQWTAPRECPNLEQIRQDVDNLLSNQPTTSPEPVSAVATVQPKSGVGYSLSLTANGQTRVIDGENCEQLAQAAALLLALLVDPAHASALSDSATEPSRKSPAGNGSANVDNHDKSNVDAGLAVLPIVEPTPKQNEPSTLHGQTEIRGLTELGARVDFGSWPIAEPALLAGLGFERNRFRLLGHVSLGKSVRLPSKTGGGLDLVVAGFDVVPAYRLVLGHWSLEFGMGAELGFAHASSQNFEPAARDTLSVSALAAVRVSRQVGRVLRAWIEPTVGYPLVRPRWVLLDGERLHRFGQFLRIQAGLEVAF